MPIWSCIDAYLKNVHLLCVRKWEFSKEAILQERIDQKEARLHGESDEASGSPKILANLLGDEEGIFCKTTAKVIRWLGLRGIYPKRLRTIMIIDGADAYPVNTVKREWESRVLSLVCMGGITDS